MHVITSPWTGLFNEFVSHAENELILMSPFITSFGARNVIENKQTSCNVRCLTTYRLSNFERVSSDIDALSYLLNNKTKLKSRNSLHAKVYIRDDEEMIITSGNLTSGGLKNNCELGVSITSKDDLTHVVEYFNELYNDADETWEITSNIVKETKKILDSSTLYKETRAHDVIIKEYETLLNTILNVEHEKFIGGKDAISNGLSGWKKEVFNCVDAIENDVFELEDVYKFERDFHEKYPENKNIKAKIRQQLQELRDSGIIEFLARGKYRKLWN